MEATEGSIMISEAGDAETRWIWEVDMMRMRTIDQLELSGVEVCLEEVEVALVMVGL
jgi:hypothetical protein